MSSHNVVPVTINPLVFFEADARWVGAPNLELTSDAVLRFLSAPGDEGDLSVIAERYRQINVEEQNLFAIPAEGRVLEKLVNPLRYAKSCYLVGNYLGTISLCGMVAEMVALLLYEIANIRVNEQSITADIEKRLFGAEFEKLGQERRVSVLNAYGLIGDNEKSAFELIREKRRKYLHFLSHGHETASDDAVRVYVAAVQLVYYAIQPTLVDAGTMSFNPSLMNYLKKIGFLDLPWRSSPTEAPHPEDSRA